MDVDKSQKKNQQVAGRIFKNFSFLVIGKTAGDAFTFILFVTLSRVYGQEGIGEYSFAMAYTGFFVVAADFGLYNLSVKEMSSKNNSNISKYFNNILTTRLLLSSGFFLLLILTIFVLPFSDDSKLIIACIGIYQIIYTITEGFTALFVSQERMHVAAMVELSFRITVAILGSAVALLDGEILYAVALFPAIAIIQLLFVTSYAIKEFSISRLHFSVKLIKQLLNEAMPYALFTLLRQISTRTDVLLLGLLVGTAAAGVYNVSYRVIFLLLFLPYFAGIAILPMASKLYESNQQDLIRFYQNALNLMILIAVPLTVGLWVISTDLILIIYGDEFTESIFIMRLLSLLLGLAFLKSIAGTMLTSCDMQIQRTRSQWTSAWLNILGNIILIPLYGVAGAAISTVISEFVLTIIMILKLKPLFGIPDIRKRFLISIMGSSTMIGSSLLFPRLHFTIFIPLSIVIYIVILFAFKTIRTRNLELMHILFL